MLAPNAVTPITVRAYNDTLRASLIDCMVESFSHFPWASWALCPHCLSHSVNRQTYICNGCQSKIAQHHDRSLANQYLNNLQKRNIQLIAALDGENVIGFKAFQRTDWRTFNRHKLQLPSSLISEFQSTLGGYLIGTWGMGVKPGYQQHGIGRLLMSAIEDPQIPLISRLLNNPDSATWRFHQKLGFHILHQYADKNRAVIAKIPQRMSGCISHLLHQSSVYELEKTSVHFTSP
ncbi:Uncharacterised protein [BD1-7 clade bacterium]|uniref:N-acetyltransferase domain-containing protein n=1 Tax=BD1-7 clade bacterium TaxID=2029982 RepID=A0A5S9PTR4_9GAMM|nr:Uncharacterised protein [BD1-7 clade bacterium]